MADPLDALEGNMRATTTARVGAAKIGYFRVGAKFRDVKTGEANQYPWTMDLGIKPLDAAATDEDSWDEDQH